MTKLTSLVRTWPAISGLSIALVCSGCASLIHGTHQSVPVTTDPPGANVTIGGESFITPTDASLARDRDYQVVANKPGYQQSITEVHSSLSGITFLDLIFIIPWAVDLADGAAYKLEPSTISMVLTPAVARAPAAAAPAAAAAPPPAAAVVPTAAHLASPQG